MDRQDLKNIPFDIKVTDMAMKQIRLLMEQDYALANLYPRLVIKGKGCNGFTYAFNFSEKRAEDTTISLDATVTLLLDEFSAQYIRVGVLDFLQTHTEEGFHFVNHHEELFHGKFFQ